MRGSGIRLEFLGAGDPFGSGGRLQTGLLLRGEGDPLQVDCGTSSLIAMTRSGTDPGEIGWICPTHLHGDHFGGLPFLGLDGQFTRWTRPLVVAGPPGPRERVTAAMEVLCSGSAGGRRRFPVDYGEVRARRHEAAWECAEGGCGIDLA
jgi:ribonuclease BN (tRNA processing enzyme)